MKRLYLLIACFLLAASLTGCAGVKTYTYEEKRVDQDLSRGNRGVIMGEAPVEETERKSTRTMVGVDITLPDTKEYKARKTRVEEEVTEREPVITFTMPPVEPVISVKPEEEMEEEEVKRVAEDLQYAVQKGDTLQKISEKFYGTARKWPEIYKANKRVIPSPSRIYPGQVITIPALELEEELVGDYK